MDTGRKSNVSYKFQSPALDSLHTVAARVTSYLVGNFEKEYGKILSILSAPVADYERGALHTLLQFYDPALRCFTFPDYQLAPTLEEYSVILGIPIQNQVPFHSSMEVPKSSQIAAALYLSKTIVEANLKPKGGLFGFHLSFLLEKANVFADACEWTSFYAILALCIYGIVLFPNVVGFVDMNAIRIFLLRNPVPTLLGDMYYAVHTRNEKKKGGLILCCTPLLYKCFKSHFPRK